MSKVLEFPRSAWAVRSPAVIALHCSGGSGRSWRHIAPALGGCFNVLTPDLIGCGASPHWTGPRRFRLEPFEVTRFVLLSARPGSGGGPYVVEAEYELAGVSG